MAKHDVIQDIGNAPPEVIVSPEETTSTGLPIIEPTEEVSILSSRKALEDIVPLEQQMIDAEEENKLANERAREREAEAAKIEKEAEPTPEEKTQTRIDELIDQGYISFTQEEVFEIFEGNTTGIVPIGSNWLASPEALARAGITSGTREEFDAKRAEQQAAKELNEANQQIEDLANEIDDFNLDLDPDFIAQEDSIKSEFDILRSNMQRINRSRQRAIEAIGFRTGARQFAGAIQLGIEGEELRQGAARIAEITREEQTALAQARAAFKQGKFSEFSIRMDARQTLRDKKLEELKFYNEKLSEINKRISEENEKIEKEVRAKNISDVIIPLIQIGFTDPIDIIAGLKQLGIEATPDEISEFTSLIANNDILSDINADARTYEFYKDTQPELLKEMGIDNPFDFIRAVEAAKAGKEFSKTGERGAEDFPTVEDLDNMNTEERNFVNAVLRQLPTKLKDSEREKKERQQEALFDFRQGKTLQETIDTFSGLVLEGNVSDEDRDLALFLRTIAAGTGLELSDIAAPINLGKPEKAMINAENAALDTIEGELRDTADARGLINNANRVLQLLEDAPIEDLGIFDGKKFKIKKLFPQSTEDRIKTQRLETAIVDLLNEIRRKSLGTAVTKTELEFLKPLLTSLEDQPDIIKTKVDELKLGTLRVHNSARQQVGIPELSEETLLNNSKRLELYRSGASREETPEFDLRLEFNNLGFDESFEDILKLYDEVQIREIIEDQKKTSDIDVTDKTFARTDRHNNPTAFTIAVAKQGGLKEGVDFEIGDKFPESNARTAKLLGDPIEQTIKVIDNIGFFTASGKPRWTHTQMSESKWNALSDEEKKNIIKDMYRKEGNKGLLNKFFV